MPYRLRPRNRCVVMSDNESDSERSSETPRGPRRIASDSEDSEDSYVNDSDNDSENEVITCYLPNNFTSSLGTNVMDTQATKEIHFSRLQDAPSDPFGSLTPESHREIIEQRTAALTQDILAIMERELASGNYYGSINMSILGFNDFYYPNVIIKDAVWRVKEIMTMNRGFTGSWKLSKYCECLRWRVNVPPSTAQQAFVKTFKKAVLYGVIYPGIFIFILYHALKAQHAMHKALVKPPMTQAVDDMPEPMPPVIIEAAPFDHDIWSDPDPISFN